MRSLSTKTIPKGVFTKSLDRFSFVLNLYSKTFIASRVSPVLIVANENFRDRKSGLNSILSYLSLKATFEISQRIIILTKQVRKFSFIRQPNVLVWPQKQTKSIVWKPTNILEITSNRQFIQKIFSFFPGNEDSTTCILKRNWEFYER